jgi:hypothetical protein
MGPARCTPFRLARVTTKPQAMLLLHLVPYKSTIRLRFARLHPLILLKLQLVYPRPLIPPKGIGHLSALLRHLVPHSLAWLRAWDLRRASANLASFCRALLHLEWMLFLFPMRVLLKLLMKRLHPSARMELAQNLANARWKVSLAYSSPVFPRLSSLTVSAETGSASREASPGEAKRVKIDRDKVRSHDRRGREATGGNRLLASAIKSAAPGEK